MTGPLGPHRGDGAVAGYSIVEAASIDEAEWIARSDPFITSVRVYEMRDQEPTGA